MIKVMKLLLAKHVFHEYHKNYLIYIYNLKQLVNNQTSQMYQIIHKCKTAYQLDINMLKRLGATKNKDIAGMLNSDNLKLIQVKDSVEDKIYDKNNESFLEKEYGIKQ